jgi:regulatory protein
LKARAITLLAQRDHSPAELRRKLLVQALASASEPPDRLDVAHLPDAPDARDARDARDEPDAPAVDAGRNPHQDVEATMEWLLAKGYLNEARFVESRVHARAQRFGNRRIHGELAQHGVQVSPETLEHLRSTEEARAHAVWEKKFGRVPTSTTLDEARRSRAQQTRFLAGRGFSAAVIASVLKRANPGRRADLDDEATAEARPDLDAEL